MNRRKFVEKTLGSAAGLAGGLPAAAPPAKAAPQRGRATPGRKRVLFLGVDAMDPAMVLRFQADLPNMRRIAREGYSGRILPYVSCWTNIGFMSMLTGAAPGTQYRLHTEAGGQPRHAECVSETIWQTLESENRRSFILNFPGAMGSAKVAVLPARRNRHMRTGAAIYQTGNVVIKGTLDKTIESTGWPPGSVIRPGRKPTVIADPQTAAGWSKLPESELPPLEAALGPWTVLLTAAEGNGYDTALVYAARNGAELARLRTGAWSDWVRTGTPETAYRFRLLELTPDGKRLQLLQSAGCAVEGFSEPEDVAAKLVAKFGPFWTGSAIPPSPNDPFWEIGQAESLEGALWVAKAAIESLNLLDWDFFLHKTELADAAMHQCLTLADPSYYRHDPEVARAADHVYRQAYIALDQVVGKLLDFVSSRNDMVLIVASDHGGGVNNTVCDVDRKLCDAGLQARNGREIDWSRTRAYTKRNRQGTEIFVNLAGREPQGIVQPGEYEKVQEAAIDTLLDWRDPRTNKRAIAYALKLRDAALIGYWGPEAGDVHFCYNPGFVWGTTPDGSAIAPSKSPISNHGPQIVTAATGYSSMMGQLLAWGPGVARGVARDERALGPIPIASVGPTLSRLLGCGTPKDSQLGPLLDLLA